MQGKSELVEWLIELNKLIGLVDSTELQRIPPANNIGNDHLRMHP